MFVYRFPTLFTSEKLAIIMQLQYFRIVSAERIQGPLVVNNYIQGQKHPSYYFTL